MIDIINTAMTFLSVLILPTIILIVTMRTEIKVLKNEVDHLHKFDASIDSKLDKIFDKLDELNKK